MKRFTFLSFVFVLLLNGCNNADHLTDAKATPSLIPVVEVPSTADTPGAATVQIETISAEASVATDNEASSGQGCDRAELVSSGYLEAPPFPVPQGESFYYIIRLTNVGSCTWTPEYAVVLVKNQSLVIDAAQAFPLFAMPGQTIDIPIKVTAPMQAGTFSAGWKLRNAEGDFFGHGAEGEEMIELTIQVGSDVAQNPSSSAGDDGGTVEGYDFIAHHCEAAWDSGRRRSLPCSGGDLDIAEGYIRYDPYPIVEGQPDPEELGAVLNVHPNQAQDGFIMGTYPEYLVGSDDHFVAVVGCMAGANNCKVKYSLHYQIPSGKSTAIAEWYEEIDKTIHFVDVDVSLLAGQKVNFRLKVEHNGKEPNASDVFWNIARIVPSAEEAHKLADENQLPQLTPRVVLVPLPNSDLCDQAHFMHSLYADVPVQNGSAVQPGTEFTVGWRLANVGTCNWSDDYKVVLVDGSGLTGESRQNFEGATKPGDTLDVYFKTAAVDVPGDYSVTWQLRNQKGQGFAVLPFSSGLLKLNFSVLDLPEGVNYDFAQLRCQAQWHSSLASFVSCNGETDESIGYANYVISPSLEGKSNGNSPVLEVKASSGGKGYIKGIYPPYTVQKGDVFVSRIGCMGGHPKCQLRFELHLITVDGKDIYLDDWVQSSDGLIPQVRVKLSEWVGKKVQLVLMMRNAGGKSQDAFGFWLDPIIENKQ